MRSLSIPLAALLVTAIAFACMDDTPTDPSQDQFGQVRFARGTKVLIDNRRPDGDDDGDLNDCPPSFTEIPVDSEPARVAADKNEDLIVCRKVVPGKKTK